jgi:tetratricopeptide (TPR) repeat protein
MFCGLDPNTGILPSRSRDNERQYALSEIDIDCTQSSNTILVDITAQNIFPHANEILFDTGTTFEIISVNYDCKHYFWHIHMKTSSKIVELNQQYEHYIDQQMKETNVNVFFGMLLTDLGDLYSIIEDFERLLARMPSKHKDRPNIYYSMARAYRFIGKYSTALKFFRRAEHLQ